MGERDIFKRDMEASERRDDFLDRVRYFFFESASEVFFRQADYEFSRIVR